MLVVVATFIAYLNVVHVGFLSLDDMSILDSLQSSSHTLWSLISGGGGDYFRPLPYLSFDLDLFLFGRDPRAFHLVNLALHISNALLLYLLTLQLVPDRSNGETVALITALLFALHPINSEAVLWVAGRYDLLAGFFFLLTLLLVTNETLQTSRVAFFLPITLMAALLSKESAVALIGIIGAYCILLRHERGNKRAVIILLVTIISSLVYLYLRLGKGGGLDSGVAKVISTTRPFSHVAYDCLAALGFYLKKLFVPFPLNFAIISINQALYVGATLIVLPVAIFLFIRSRQARLPLLIIFVSLFPPLMALQGKLPWTPYAERYLYLSSMGFSLLVSFAVMQLRAIPRVAVISLILLLAIPIMSRVNVWADSKRFWQEIMKESPMFPRSYVGVAYELMEEQKYDEAEILLKKALAMGYERDFVWQNLALTYLARKDMVHYESSMARAAELSPNSTWKYISLTLELMKYASKSPDRNEIYQRVAKYYIQAYERDNKYIDGLYSAGKIYLLLGMHKQALEYLALFIDKPGDTMYKPFAKKLITANNLNR